MGYKCRLNVIFAERDIRKLEFAKKVGINAGTLSNLCNNRTLPTFEIAMRIAKELGIKVEEIWIVEEGGES